MNTLTLKTNKSKLKPNCLFTLQFILKSFLLDEQLSIVLSTDDIYEVIYDNEYQHDIL